MVDLALLVMVVANSCGVGGAMAVLWLGGGGIARGSGEMIVAKY